MHNRFINKLRGFVDLTDAEVQALVGATSVGRAMSSKQDLIREGDRPGPVFVMLEGWAIRYKILPAGSRQITAFLMPGDACDLHTTMLAEMDHSIQTITSSWVAMIPRVRMDELMAEYSGIARAMYIAQLVDEGVLRAWIVSLGRRKSIERVAHLILELFVRGFRTGLTDGTAMDLPLSQMVLADATGMTAVHVNRVLQALRVKGAITLSRGVLRIENAKLLTEISGFDANYLFKRLT